MYYTVEDARIYTLPDSQHHLASLQKFIDAGYEYVYVHQIGPNQEGFFRFYQHEILPKLP